MNRTKKNLVIATLLAIAGCTAPVGDGEPLPGEHAEPYRGGDGWAVFELDPELEGELDLSTLSLITHEGEEAEVNEVELPITEAVWDESGLRVAIEGDFEPGHLYHLVSRTEEGLRTLDTVVSRAPEGNAAGLTFAAILFPVGDNGKIKLPPPPPPPPTGDFALASTTPADFAMGVGRDLDMIRLQFTDDEQIDCARTGTSPQAGRLVSEIPGVANHSFFHSAIQEAGNPYHRGTLECDPLRNELRFHIPQTGDLYGKGWYRFRTSAWSTVGSRQTFEVLFHTENPGLRVQVTQIHSHKDNCGSHAWLFPDGCDVYLATHVAIDGDETATVKLPDRAGNDDFEDLDHRRPRRIDSPTIIETTSNIGRSVRLNVFAFDHDDDSARDVVAGIGTVLTATAPICSACGAAGGIATATASVIPDNDDDKMGDMELFFVDNTNRWNTTARPYSGDPAFLGRRYDFPNGNMSVWVRTQEWPEVWQPGPVID